MARDQFLKGQVALVTGGTQGIGWALAQALADHGAQVYACGRSLENLQRAQQAVAELPWQESIHLAQCDVTDRQALQNWIHGVYDETGRLDVLVNNAAFVRWQDVETMSLEAALQTMRVSYDGLVVAVKTVLPLMIAAGRGHIVNMGSMTARIFVPGSSAAYAAAKAAVDAYSLMLQIELENSPVNVTLVRLATVAGTDFFKKHVPVNRMSPLTQFMPALTPPKVADAVLLAIYKKQAILTMPRYMHLLGIVYQIIPRISRWLARIGGRNERDYGQIDWRYRGRE